MSFDRRLGSLVAEAAGVVGGFFELLLDAGDALLELDAAATEVAADFREAAAKEEDADHPDDQEFPAAEVADAEHGEDGVGMGHVDSL